MVSRKRLYQQYSNKANASTVTSLSSTVSSLSSQVASKANSSTVNNLSSQVASLSSAKADKSGNSQIKIIRDTPLASIAYSNAPLVIETSNNSASAPGIGFHNPNKEGGFLYLQDTQLRFMNSAGEIFNISKTKIGDAPKS